MLQIQPADNCLGSLCQGRVKEGTAGCWLVQQAGSEEAVTQGKATSFGRDFCVCIYGGGRVLKGQWGLLWNLWEGIL